MMNEGGSFDVLERRKGKGGEKEKKDEFCKEGHAKKI